MHCIVLFRNEEFAGAGVIKKCCCVKEKTHLMLLLLIPVGWWKGMELFVLLWCQWKTHISEWTCLMHRTTGLFAPCNSPEQLKWGWDSTALPRAAAFPGAGGWGKGCCSPASIQVPLAWPAQAHVPVLVTAAATRFNRERGNFHQAYPAGSPQSHQTCHLSHSTSLVPANTVSCIHWLL